MLTAIYEITYAINSFECVFDFQFSVRFISHLCSVFPLPAADVTALHYASDAIVVTVRGAGFGTQLVRALDATAKLTSDGNNLSRYGWMFGSDIEVLSAIARPTAGIRAPKGEEGNDANNDYNNASGGLSLQQTNLLLLGVAFTAVLILAVVIFMHMRLRQAHALYEKDKGTLSRGGQALHKMFNNIAASAAKGIVEVSGAVSGTPSLHEERQRREIEMSKRGLMDSRIDEDLED